MLSCVCSDHYTISPDDCQVLGSLKGLQCLSIRSWLPRPFSADLKVCEGGVHGLQRCADAAVRI